MEKTFKYIYITILAIIAILALAVIVSTSSFFGRQAYVVMTGSMSPKIPAGSLIFDSKEQKYNIGDAITFITPGVTQVTNTDNLVTHRIVAIKTVGQMTNYQVKGDANNTPDTNLVPKNNVVGKVNFSIPKVGYPVDFIKSLPGIIIFIIIPATIIVYEELRNIMKEIVKIRREAKLIEKEIVHEEKRFTKWIKKLRQVTTIKKPVMEPVAIAVPVPAKKTKPAVKKPVKKKTNNKQKK